MGTTKETILNELKHRGQARADELSQDLSLTAMAVRQHLYQLQEDGAVICETKAQARGRPAKYWSLTSKADIYFQDTHRDLSLDIIDSIRETLGEEALNKLVTHRTQKQAAKYQSVLDSRPTLEEKVKALAEIRSAEGYMADSETVNDGSILLKESHCPICEAAKSCSGICSQELSLFKQLLASHAEVERVEHVLSGARRCAYSIKKRD